MEKTMITKILPFEVKEVAPRTLEFIGSTEDKDREGDIIMAQGWQLKNYKKNPVFLWGHSYDEPPIGKTVKVWHEDGKLKFHVQFAEKDTYEFADTIYKLYKGGFLRATSVGFMPLESEPIEVKDDEIVFHQPTRYLKQELLELSGCPVPANPNALAEAKAKGLIKDFWRFMPETEDIDKPYPNEHACRLRNPDDFQEGTFKRTEREHEGKRYSIIMGRLKGETTMTEQAYRYDKEVWTAAQAKSHCKEHDGTFEAASSEESDKQTYNCECIECGYKMESDKHCGELKCPKCGGQMRRVERPGPGQGNKGFAKITLKDENGEEISHEVFALEENKSAISYQSAHPNGTPKAGDDVEWDAAREVASAEVDDLKVMCCIMQGDADKKTSYKLPHHLASGKHDVVWKGVAAVGAVLMGARGGIDASEAEKSGAKAHLAKHYEEFDKEPPWEKGISQESIADEIDYLAKTIDDEGLNDENIQAALELVRGIMRLSGDDIPVDIAEKIGAVLNRVNLERLEKIKSLAQEVIDSARHEDEPDKALSREEIKGIVSDSIKAAIEEAQGKIRR